MSVLSIAMSGMAAATAKLNVSAQNVANSQSYGALPDAPPPASPTAAPAPRPYQPQQLLQFSVADSQGAGVATRVEPRQGEAQKAYDPTASFADAQGLVAAPDIDQATEVVDQMQALQSFKANMKVFKAGDEMMAVALNLKA